MHGSYSRTFSSELGDGSTVERWNLAVSVAAS
jgi:hypothetical protein